MAVNYLSVTPSSLIIEIKSDVKYWPLSVCVLAANNASSSLITHQLIVLS